MSETYDFIIVGGGTSGSALARRLADASPNQVLLLEGGGTNTDPALRTPESRWSIWMTEPLVNWRYASIPQQQLHNRILPCSRGRGLGGSSCINFSNWVIGHRKDYDRIAELTGDGCWKWEGDHGVKERFKRIERLHAETAEGYEKYFDLKKLGLHSKEGMVDLSYDSSWPEFATPVFEASKEWGVTINDDLNSGDLSGWGLTPSTYFQGSRVTASRAYLSSPPANLTILPNHAVTKIIFDDSKKAVGVQTISGKSFSASREVILSAGAIDSPRILLLSGIGPPTDLSKLSIPIISDLPGVGKNLQDHTLSMLTLLLRPEAKTGSQETTARSDPNTATGVQMPSAWLSLPSILSSPEYAALDATLQKHLAQVPLVEFGAFNFPMSCPLPSPDAQVMTFISSVMNPQSLGTVSISSSNPSDPPLIDPNYGSHPYDRRVITEGMRALLEFVKMPSLADITEKMIEGPKSESEEDIWEHFQSGAWPLFHFGGTCRMGKDGDDCVVDPDFRVRGVKGLRVVDHSVMPELINNHSQSTCYLIGETAAEKIIDEYSKVWL